MELTRAQAGVKGKGEGDLQEALFFVFSLGGEAKAIFRPRRGVLPFSHISVFFCIFSNRRDTTNEETTQFQNNQIVEKEKEHSTNNITSTDEKCFSTLKANLKEALQK